MKDWTSGYIADIGYTFGYYTELNPLRIKLAFLNSGIIFPEISTACELGFGQGVSVNLHAAATPTTWYGTDFNPAQASCAQEFAKASGANLKLFDESFEEFINRKDLPDFDYIGLHGIWSWISDQNRKIIVDFIKKKLRVGGVLYTSYNTLPGWSAFAPMRHLLTAHAENQAAQGQGIVSKIDGAIDFAEKLLVVNPLYSRANPQIADRVKTLKTQNRHYLAHEYFNQDWHPMHFSTLAEYMNSAKLNYACSAHYLDHIAALNLSNEQLSFLNEIPDNIFRETTRDFIINQQFRRDYWVKGARKLSPAEQRELLDEQRVILVSHRADVSLKVMGALGEATMSESIYVPILDYLSDHKIRTLQEVGHAAAAANVNFSQFMQAIMVLIGAGHIAPAQDDSLIAQARKTSDKINKFIMKKSRTSSEISHLCSPVTAGGYGVGRFNQLFALAIIEGKSSNRDCARFVWEILDKQGQKLIKDSQTLQSAEENIEELTAQAHVFENKFLPILKALQIV